MPVLKFDEIPYEKVRDGLGRKIIHTESLMTVLIDFSDGPWNKPEPPHSHPHEQTSYVAEGEILFLCEGEAEQHLKKGDMFAVRPGRKHTIQLLTEYVRLVDSFHPQREDFLQGRARADRAKK